MALEGTTIGSSAGSGANAPAPSAAPAPAPSSKALSGVSIKGSGALSGVNIKEASSAATAGPAPAKSATSDLDIKPLSASEPANLSSFFPGFKDAVSATTPKTVIPKSDTAVPPSPSLDLNFSNAPDLSNPVKVNTEGNALDVLGKQMQKDSDALDKATSDLQAQKLTVDPYDQASIDKYNAAVEKYQAQVDIYNKNYTEYSGRVDNYNKIAGTNNSAAVYGPTLPGKSLSGSSISADDGSSKENSLREYLSSQGAPEWMSNNPVVDEVGTSYNTLQNSIDSFGKAGKEPVSSQAGKLLTVVTNFGNMLFSPISGVIKAAASDKDPNSLLRVGAQGITSFFSMFGNALKNDVETPLELLGVKSDLAGPISDLVSLIGQAWVGESIHEAMPVIKEKVADIHTTFTKDVISTHFPGQRIFFDSTKVRDIWQTGKLLSSSEKADILKTIGSDPAKIKDALKNGIAISIEPRTLVTLQDKPYWSKIKSFFGIGPEDPTVVSDQGGAPSATVRGYLPPGDVHPILKAEIRQTVDDHGPETTHKALQHSLGVDENTASRVMTDALQPTAAEAIERAKNPQEPAVPAPVSAAMEKARVAVQGRTGEAESMNAGPVSDKWIEAPELPQNAQKSTLYKGEGERYFVSGQKGAYHVDNQGIITRSPETPEPRLSSNIGFGKAIPDKSLDLTQKLTSQEYTAFNTAYANVQDKLEIPSENQRSLPSGLTGQEAFNHITGTSGLLGHENETAAQIVEILKRKGYKKFPKGFGPEEKASFKEGTIYNPDEKRIEEIKQNGGVVEYKKGGKIARIKQAIKGDTGSEIYEGEKDLTTKVLTRLEGRDTVSKQFISDLTNSADLKQQERDIVREALSQYPDGKDVSVKDFAEKVKAELLPLERTVVGGKLPPSRSEDGIIRGLAPRYEFVSLPENQRGNVADYSEHVYQSPVKTSAGDVHFNSAKTPGYFGHTRVEDMANSAVEKSIKNGDEVSKEDLSASGGTTRRIIEVQSDLYQKGRLENETRHADEILDNPTYAETADARAGFKNPAALDAIVKQAKDRKAQISKLRQYSNPTAHFRMVREEVKQAAKDGKSTLLFPTGETAMKIEGLGGQHQTWFMQKGPLEISDLKPGLEVTQGGYVTGSKWIITDVLGDGKFKAVPKDVWERTRNPKIVPSGDGGFNIITDKVKGSARFGSEQTAREALETVLNRDKEAFDISGKVDTSNPIYRFYEKDLGRYLKGKYDAKPFTDEKGVTWNKVDVKPEMAGAPVEAFKKGPQGGFKQSPDKIRQVINSLIPEKDVRLVFKTDLIDGIATGKYSRSADILSTGAKPLIELAENNGKISTLDALHEAGHFIFDNYLSDSEKRSMLDAAHEEMGILEKGKYRINGYKGNDQVALEYLMDQYAKQKASDMGFKGPLRRAMEAIDRIVRSVYEAFKKVKDYLSEIPNKEGGFFGVPDEEKAKMDELAAGAEKHVDENADALKAQYLEKHGNNFNVDKMKDLIPGHAENKTMSEAFHKPAAKLMADLVDERLQGPGNDKEVVFTAGATAAGKTSAIEGLREGKDRLADAHAIIDGTLASDRSLKEIGKALKNGYEVTVKYVENSPERIADNLINRAQIDKDRTVPIETAYNSLFKSRQHLQRIAGKYGDNPKFNVEVIDNSKDVPEIVENGIDFLKDHPYSKDDIERFKAEAYQKADTLHQNGEIESKVYNGLVRRKGDSAEGAVAGDSAYHGEESGSGREGKEGQAKVTALPDEAADTATKQAHVSFNTDINRLVEDPSYDHLPNTVVNTKSAERLDALEERAQDLALRKDVLDQNPARHLAKYASKRTGELPTVTGGEEAKSEFAKRGDDIVTEYGFKTPEEANEAVVKYLDDKKRFNEAVLVFMEEKRSLMEQFRADKDKYGDPTSHKPGNYDFEITENNKGVVPPEVRGGIQSPELDFSSWKDKMVPRLARDTMERNLEKVAPEKDAAKAKKFLIDPIRANELARVNFVNDLHEKIRAKMKELGIKRRTKLDRLVHIYAEEKINPLGLSRELDGDADRIKRVEDAVTYLRGIYANLLTDWNERRIEFGYQPIPERQNYMRHFTDINQFVNSFGFLRSESQLPTAIAGVSQHFKPGKPFTTAELRRTGDRTSYSAIGGMQNYLETVSKQMFHIDSIQRGRALERYLRDVAKQNPNLRLPNFAGNLSEWTNLVAGKASVLDRSIETGLAGRPVMKFINTASNLLARNIIVGNISVALTHLVSLPLNAATTAKIPLGKATVMTVIEGAVRGIDKAAVITGLQHTLISPLANEPFTSVDGVQSSFLARRYPSKSIQPTLFDSIQNTLGWLFHLTDQFKTKLTVSGKYYELKSKGFWKDGVFNAPVDTEEFKQAAMAEADNYAGRIIGDYSVGMKPNVLSAHTTKLIAQFQLGVNDSVSVLAHDIPKWGKAEGDWKKTAWKTGSMFVQFAVFSFLFNQLYMKMRGSGKGIDPIDAGLTLLGLNDEGKGQDFLHRLGLAGADLAGELPFTSIFTGGFPLASAIGQPLQQIGKSQWGPAVESLLADFASPIGGGQQVKKSIQGILAYNAGETTTAAGQTNMPVDKTWLNLMRGIVFGPTGFVGASSAKTETNNLMNMLAASKGTTAKAAEAWYTQYESDKVSDPAKALDEWNNLLSSNPKLATEVKKVADAAKSGITLNERLIKLLGVANGERAQYVYGKYEALPDKAAKDAFWNDYVTKKIISPAVADQIKALIASGGKAPTGSGKAPDPGTGKATFEGHPTYYAGSSGPDTDKILGGNSDDGTIKGHNPNNEPIYARDVQLEASRKAEMFAQDPYWKQNGYTMQTIQFDHAIPLEAGGTNTASNVQLISQQADEQNQPFEDWLGAQYKAGKISRADAARAAIDYKINKSVSFDDVKAGKY